MAPKFQSSLSIIGGCSPSFRSNGIVSLTNNVLQNSYINTSSPANEAFYNSYEKLSVYGTHKNVDISDLTSEIEIVVDKFNSEKNSVGESSLSMLNAIMPTLK